MSDSTEKITKNTRILNFKTLNSTNRTDIKKFLKKFFNDPDYYFKEDLKDNYLLFDKVIKKNPSNSLLPTNIQSLNNDPPKKKLTHLALKKNNLQARQSLSETSFVDKRKNLYSSNQPYLKNGQIYITDNEIDEIFNSFKLIQSRNSENNSSNNTLQRRVNFFKKDSFYKKLKNSRNELNSQLFKNIYINNKNSKSTNNKKIKIQNNNFKNSSNIDFNKTETTTYTNYNNKIINNTSRGKTEKSEDILKSMKSPIRYIKSQKTYYDNQISRNNLIEKQNQFLTTISLPNNPIKVNQKHCAELLSRQEQVFLKQKKNKYKLNNIKKVLSKKTNKEKNNLLLVNFEDSNFKKIYENKYDEMTQNLYPEKFYNWEEDLREKGNFTKDFRRRNRTQEELKNIIDDDNNEKKYTITKSVLSYLKEKLPLKKYLLFNKYMNKLRVKKENIKKLSIEGKNLLNFEYQHIKNNFKGKKILNKYENFLTSRDINDKLCAKNEMMNIFHEKAFHSKKYLSI